jgi:hypothetical protein
MSKIQAVLLPLIDGSQGQIHAQTPTAWSALTSPESGEKVPSLLLQCLKPLRQFQPARFCCFLTRGTQGLNTIPYLLLKLSSTLWGKQHDQRHGDRGTHKGSRCEPKEPIHHVTSVCCKLEL